MNAQSTEVQPVRPYMPTRKVTAGLACGGLVTFVAGVYSAFGGPPIPEAAWVGLVTAMTFIVQYRTTDR